MLDEEGLQLIENNADTILEEVGIEFRDMPEALEILKQGGAEIDGVRVRFPRGLCRSIIQASAPAEYTQHARNSLNAMFRSVVKIRFSCPLMAALLYTTSTKVDVMRRWKTFKNFVKLAYSHRRACTIPVARFASPSTSR